MEVGLTDIDAGALAERNDQGDSFKEIFEDKRINSIKIKIEKPDAITNAKSVGVEVFKNRSDYEGS